MDKRESGVCDMDPLAFLASIDRRTDLYLTKMAVSDPPVVRCTDLYL